MPRPRHPASSRVSAARERLAHVVRPQASAHAEAGSPVGSAPAAPPPSARCAGSPPASARVMSRLCGRLRDAGRARRSRSTRPRAPAPARPPRRGSSRAGWKSPGGHGVADPDGTPRPRGRGAGAAAALSPPAASCRQRRRRAVPPGVGDDVGGERHDRVARLGQPGVAHDHEHLQVAVVDGAVDRAGREPDHGARAQRGLADAGRVERSAARRGRRSRRSLGRGDVHVRGAAGESVGAASS